jgi:hypothetical protein
MKCLNHDLHELGDWSKRWLMSFNPDKTEIMLFKNVENSTNFYFYFDGKLNINNFQTILINSLLFHNVSFYVSNLCAKLYRKPLRNHRKRSNIVLFFQESLR